MTARVTKRLMTLVSVALLALVAMLAGSGDARHGSDRWSFHDLTTQQARGLASSGPAARTPARAAATWCGTPSNKDLVPNGLAGNPVHWIYMSPSDEADQLPTYANVMQTDAEAIDAWWRSQDPSRAPRNDVAPSSCGLQVDLTAIRLTQPGAQLASIETRADTIADTLVSARLLVTAYEVRHLLRRSGRAGDLRPGRKRRLRARLRDGLRPSMSGSSRSRPLPRTSCCTRWGRSPTGLPTTAPSPATGMSATTPTT